MKSLNFESISVTVESYCIYCNGSDGEMVAVMVAVAMFIW
jgi:hypothetical protein